MKKITALLLTLSLCISPIGMQKVEAARDMSTYLMTEDGWYYMDNAPYATICGYREDVEELVIPTTIAEGLIVNIIDYNAFEGAQNLKTVTIPASVERIEDEAFMDCTALETVIYEEPTTDGVGTSDRFWLELENSVFENCISLTDTAFPSDIYQIGEEAFSGCQSLTEITIPETIRDDLVGKYAFANCTNLTKANIENRMQYMPEGLFYGCDSLTSLTLPDTLTHIGTSSFQSCTTLTDLQLPDSVISIGESAYRNCTNLEVLMFPDSVRGIGEYAFTDCTNVNDVYLSQNLERVWDHAFSGCIAIEKIVFPYGFLTMGIGVFSECSNLTDVYLPKTVTDIYEGSFVNCSENLTIHTTEDADEVIMYAQYDHEPEIALEYDYEEEYIFVPDLVWGDWEYYLNEDDKAVISGYNGEEEEVIIPSKVEENIPVVGIGNYAFLYNEDIERVTIPSGITFIGASAFNTCIFLRFITIPDSVTEIHGTAFAGQNSLTISGNAHSTAVQYAIEKGLKYQVDVMELVFEQDEITMKVGDYLQVEVQVLPEFATNKEVVLTTSDPNIVLVDGYDLEALCTGTATITATAADGSGIYAECRVTVVEDLESGEDSGNMEDEGNTDNNGTGENIGNTNHNGTGENTGNTNHNGISGNTGNANHNETSGNTGNTNHNEGNSGVKEEEVEEGILPAGRKSRDDKNTGVYLITKLKSSGAEVSFVGVANKKATTITIPKTVKIKGITYKVTAIGSNAFKNNKKLKKVTIGANITKIGKNTFLNCKKLKTIDIKSKKLQTIEKAAFKGIHAKAVIKVPKAKLKAYKTLLKNKGQGKKVKIK